MEKTKKNYKGLPPNALSSKKFKILREFFIKFLREYRYISEKIFGKIYRNFEFYAEYGVQRQSPKGFSLIEVMVAILILGGTFISIMHSFPLSISFIKSAENATIASYLAQDKIEEVYSLSYDNIPVGTIEPKVRLSSDPASYLYFYQRRTDVNYIDGNLNNSGSNFGMKKINVFIYYTNGFSKKENVYHLSTIISEK